MRNNLHDNYWEEKSCLCTIQKGELTAIIGFNDGEKNMNSKRTGMAALHMINTV